MTAPATAPSTTAVDTAGSARFAGTATLLRFMLRRDRVYLPGWALGIGLFWVYCTRAVPAVYDTEEDLEGVAQLMVSPMSRLLVGPGFGFDEITYERFLAGGYGLYIIVLVALMSILLMVRHTRGEEQAGRAELIRANVVGRHAPLTAALGMAVIANTAVALVVAGVMLTDANFATGGSLLFAVGAGAAGLAFAGLTTVTVQLSEHARTTGGIAGGGLGVAFMIRALGDMISEGGSFVSWLSPLAWSQQTAPFVLDRWWPLLLSFAFAAGTTMLGYALSARRDVGASMFAVQPGPARAPSWLGTPLTLAVRLQRASILTWTAALAGSGFIFGVWTDAMLTSFEDLPDALIDIIGSEDDIVGGYLSLMALCMALIAGAFVILGVQGLRSEETVGRGEPLLALPISRAAWLGTNLLVIAIGVVLILGATGAATGLGATMVTGDAIHVWEVTVAHLAYVPALLLVLGLATLLFGVAPRLIAATWIVPGFGLVVGVFGPLMDLQGWAFDLSPFEHVPDIPLEPFTLLPLAWLSLIAAAGVALGLLAFRRRDIDAV